MKILLTGGAGYLGSVLLPKLLRRQHDVRVVDNGYFGFSHLKNMLPNVDLVREDLCLVNKDPRFLAQLLDGVDAVIHLAAMSNDPTAELDPKVTREVNTTTTATIAKACKQKGTRFLFSSSCSIYGGSSELIDESGKKGPLTTYAVSKVEAENALLELSDEKWRPIILRNGTLFGYSPRMRFDLVVNTFSLFSSLKNEIKVFGAGEQWRPFLHVSDCARAFIHFMEKGSVKHPIYNIGHENMTVAQLASLFQTMNPALKVVSVPGDGDDRRNYRVVVDRMREEGFETRVSVAMGAEEIQDAIVSGAIPDPESVLYQNVKWLKQLGLNPPRGRILRAA